MAAKKKPTEQAKSGTAEQTGTLVNGILVPAGVTHYRLFRDKGEPTGACAVRVGSTRIELFALSDMPPSWDLVLGLWGSGAYRYQWFRPKGEGQQGLKTAGFSRAHTWDDPAQPPKPLYFVEGPGAAPAPPPEPPPAPTVDPIARMLETNAAGGKIEVGFAFALLTLARDMEAERSRRLLDDMRRAREEDAERRRRDREDEAERRQRDRDERVAEQERLAQFYRAQMQAMRELRAPPPSEDDAIDDLHDELTQLRETIVQQTEMQKSFIERAAETVLPMIAAKFMGGAVAPPAAMPAPVPGKV